MPYFDLLPQFWVKKHWHFVRIWLCVL